MRSQRSRPDSQSNRLTKLLLQSEERYFFMQATAGASAATAAVERKSAGYSA